MEEQNKMGIKKFFVPSLKGYIIFAVTSVIHWIYLWRYEGLMGYAYDNYGFGDLWNALCLILVILFFGYLILEFVIKIKHCRMCGPTSVRILEYVVFTIIAGFTELINLCMFVEYHQV